LSQKHRCEPLSDELIVKQAKAFTSTTLSPSSLEGLGANWLESFKRENDLVDRWLGNDFLTADDRQVIPLAVVAPPSSLELQHAPDNEDSKREEYSDDLVESSPDWSQNSPHVNRQDSPTSDATSPVSSAFLPLQESVCLDGNTDLLLRHCIPVSLPSWTSSRSPMHGLDCSAPDPHLLMALATNNESTCTSTVPTAATLSPFGEFEDNKENEPASVAPQSASRAVPNADEAFRALELVQTFIERQTNIFVDFQEGITLGKLIEKLKRQSCSPCLSV